jgi:hypothetical protein
VYPTASIITTSQKLGDANAYELWIQLKANGVLIYSGSSTGTGFNSGVPGNAIVEYTASIPQISSWTSGNAFTSSLQVQNLLRYNSPEYALDPMVNLFQNVILSSSISENTLQYSFPAIPGGYYELDADGNVSGVNYAYSASLCGTGQTSSFISDDELVSGDVYLRYFFDNPTTCATVTFVKVTSQAPTANTSWQPVSGCGDPEC